jgi:parallel beta-helix repeat protein
MPDKSTAELIQTVQHATRWFRPDWGQRIAAANQLGNQRIQEATSVLCEIIKKDENSELTQTAIQALGEIGSLEAADFLIRLLERMAGKPYQSAVLSNIEKCIEMIGRTGALSAVPTLLGLWSRLPSTAKAKARTILLRMNPTEATPLLLQTLAGGSQTPQDLVKELLTQMATPDTLIAAMAERPGHMEFLSGVLVGQGNRATPALVKALTTREVVSEAIEKALYQLGDTVLPALMQAWATADEAARQRIVSVLTRRGAAAVPTMITFMVEGGLGEKELAAGLSAMGEVAVLPLLAESGHQQVLGVLAQMPDSVAAVIKRGKVEPTHLQTMLKIPNDRIQRAAFEQLAASGAEAIEPLLDLWQTGSPEVVRYSEDALVKVGDPAITRLVALLANPDGQMRRRVADLLSKMSGPTIATLRPSLNAWKSLAEPPQLMRVGPDGDVPDLAVAVDQAHEGAVLLLMPGDHTLEQSLLVSKALTLLGGDRDHTHIQGDGTAHIMRFQGDGPFRVAGLTFQRTGQEGNVVEAAGGEVTFDRCRFIGGIVVWDPDAITSMLKKQNPDATDVLRRVFEDDFSIFSGGGLVIEGHTSGTVRACEFVENQWAGIFVRDEAHPLLLKNLSRNNSASGIAYFNRASGVATANQCIENGEHGIVVSGEAHPELSENLCAGNKKTGIGFFGETSGTVHKNRCVGQGVQVHGIYVDGQAHPSLKNNQCEGHELGGISYYNEGAGEALENRCTKNLIGIGAGGQAKPEIRSNVCQDNRCGIHFSGQAVGVMQSNRCIKNITGITVNEEAHPTLYDNICQGNQDNGIEFLADTSGKASRNTCTDNGGTGIVVFDQSRPTLESNICSKNAGHGIRVGENASPLLEGNTCEQNERSGLIYFGNAGGSARRNRFLDNGLGIGIVDEAEPTLEENRCERNRDIGIQYVGASAGSAIGNICRENGSHGIQIADQCCPDVRGNTCNNNGGSGIVYYDEAVGIANNNTCNHNDSHGFQVGDSAHPTLENNTCRGNQQSGIIYFSSAAGIARGNRCIENAFFGLAVAISARPSLQANSCHGNGRQDEMIGFSG